LRSSVNDLNDSSVDLPNNYSPADSINDSNLKKRTSYFPCPAISEKDNNTLSAAFTSWQTAGIDNSEAGNECAIANIYLVVADIQTGKYSNIDISEQVLLGFAWKCIDYLKLYPVCVGATARFDFMKPCFDDLAADGKIKGYSRRDNGDKPQPKPGDPSYYTSPGFFPYPMPPTPAMAEDLKTSLGNAFDEWQANTDHGHPTCKNELGSCNEADSITTKTDYTPIDERQKRIENCIKDLIEHPNCFEGYYSRDVLEPYLTKLIDQGKTRDEDGKIKKFWRR
jgi:hypothetical protein